MNNPNIEIAHSDTEKGEIRKALLSIEPKTPMAKKMIELSLQGLDEGVELMSADEILEYLGRKPL